MLQPLVAETKTVAHINVTPIIDVALVLVIILLITAPMIATADLEVKLPHATTRKVEDEARVSVTMNAEGQLAVDDQVVTRRTLQAALAKKLKGSSRENMLVVVRADAGTMYTTVDDIIKDIRATGAKRIAIATQQREGKAR